MCFLLHSLINFDQISNEKEIGWKQDSEEEERKRVKEKKKEKEKRKIKKEDE